MVIWFLLKANLLKLYILQIHKMIHHFRCKMCGKGFKCKTSLDHHILCHTDYMPYSCLVCDKKFRQPQGLWRHKKYHQTEKPHVCNVCSKAFCHKGEYYTHEQVNLFMSVVFLRNQFILI